MSVKSTFSAHRRIENGVANGTEKEEKTTPEKGGCTRFKMVHCKDYHRNCRIFFDEYGIEPGHLCKDTPAGTRYGRRCIGRGFY